VKALTGPWTLHTLLRVKVLVHSLEVLKKENIALLTITTIVMRHKRAETYPILTTLAPPKSGIVVHYCLPDLFKSLAYALAPFNSFFLVC
jgi:hypothetical protein